MSVAFTDVLIGDVSALVDDENRRRSEAVAEEVEDVVTDWHVVIFARVQNGEVGAGFCDYRFGSAEVVGADSQHFCTSVRNLVVVFLQLT